MPRIAGEVPEALPDKVKQTTPTQPPLLYAARAAATALAFKPDVIFNGHLYHGPLALALTQLSGAKLISQLHGTEVWTQLAPRHLVALERSDIVLCVSRDTRAKYLNQSVRHNALVVNNTVGAQFTLGDRAAARAHFQVGDHFVLLTVSRLDTRDGYKGHDKVIAALPRVIAATGRKVKYLVAGIGGDRPRLEQLVSEMGLADVVHFLGKVPLAELPDLYRAADMFVMPSTGEGFGIAFLEAMASGTLAIGIAVGGAPDALADGALGVCVPAGEDFARALAGAISAQAPDPELLASSVQARFGLPIFVKNVHDVFAQLKCG
jgi:phosphatidylinositol alpha-1,6-mannosyltransferase